MAEIRMRSAATGTVRTIDRGTVSAGRIKNMASELQGAGKRLEGYGINTAEGESSVGEADDADGEMAGRFAKEPAGAIRFTDKAKGLIKSRSFIRKKADAENAAGRAVSMSAAEIKAYQKAGRKAFQKKKHMEKTAVKTRRAGEKLLEKANALIKLQITASKSMITAFAALGGAVASCPYSVSGSAAFAMNPPLFIVFACFISAIYLTSFLNKNGQHHAVRQSFSNNFRQLLTGTDCDFGHVITFFHYLSTKNPWH